MFSLPTLTKMGASSPSGRRQFAGRNLSEALMATGSETTSQAIRRFERVDAPWKLEGFRRASTESFGHSLY